ALQFLALTGDATVNATNGTTLLNANASSFGRFDVRLTAFTAGAQNLNLNGFTLTKVGTSQFSLVNADITAGNIVINQGLLSIEGTSAMPAAGSSIAVNAGAGFGFFGQTGTMVVPITVNGGTVGDQGNAANLGAPIAIGAGSPNIFFTSGGATLSGQITTAAGSTATEFAKRGSGSAFLTNVTNSFTQPVVVY